MDIYLDCAAASRPAPETLEFYLEAMRADYANQEALHSLAYAARQHLAEAENELLAALGFAPEHFGVIWSASGTECFRIVAEFLTGKKTVSSVLEHPALAANFRGKTEFSQLKCDRSGQIILPEDAVSPDAVIFHHVQSETGLLQDQSRLFGAFDRALKISDSVQSAAKLPLEMMADIHIVSGVKFGAPGGAALICRKVDGVFGKLEKFVKTMRDRDYSLSRLSVPLCRAMAFAASGRAKCREQELIRITQLKEKLHRNLAAFSVFPLLPEEAKTSPYINNFFLPGIQAAVIVRALSAKGIHCASGSACAAESGMPSPALLALGKSKKDAYSGFRVSFDSFSNENDVDFLSFELEKALKNY